MANTICRILSLCVALIYGGLPYGFAPPCNKKQKQGSLTLLLLQFFFVLVVSIPCKSSQFHNLDIIENPIKVLAIFQNNGFAFNAFLSCEYNTFLLAYLLSVYSCGLYPLSGSLLKIGYFLSACSKASFICSLASAIRYLLTPSRIKSTVLPVICTWFCIAFL